MNEDSTNMREFFEREIERHNRKKTKLKQKQKTLQAITKQLREVQIALTEKDRQLRKKEHLYKNLLIEIDRAKKREKEYKQIIEKYKHYFDITTKSKSQIRK